MYILQIWHLWVAISLINQGSLWRLEGNTLTNGSFLEPFSLYFLVTSHHWLSTPIFSWRMYFKVMASTTLVNYSFPESLPDLQEVCMLSKFNFSLDNLSCVSLIINETRELEGRGFCTTRLQNSLKGSSGHIWSDSMNKIQFEVFITYTLKIKDENYKVYWLPNLLSKRTICHC